MHSQGEFVFDYMIEGAFSRSGIDYFPKMLVAVPFTPASGARVLVKAVLSKAVQNEIRRMVGVFLQDIAETNGFSSVHVNFCEDTEGPSVCSVARGEPKGGSARRSISAGRFTDLHSFNPTASVPPAVSALRPAGYMHRKTMQFHWRNCNKETGVPYADFDDYLAAFRSKRRSKIKKEIRSVEEAGYGFQMLRGAEIPDALFEEDTIFRLYQSTIERFFYGRQYLNERFFRLLKDHFREHVCLVLAREGQGQGDIVAGTFNVVNPASGRFYGRYWGSIAPEEIPNMHFVCCYYVRTGRRLGWVLGIDAR